MSDQAPHKPGRKERREARANQKALEARQRVNPDRPDFSTGLMEGDFAGPEFIAGQERDKHRPSMWGRRGFFGGRIAAVDSGLEITGPTTQLCGLFPFVAGVGAPRSGVPVGMHLMSGETVCYSPFGWVNDGLVTNPGAFVIAQPGVGKSAMVKRILIALAAQGVRTIIMGDVKPDYPDVVRALGGQVVTLGRGHGTINPLDPGPIARAADRLRAAGLRKEANGLEEEAHARRLILVRSLVEIGRRGDRISSAEETVLTVAVKYLESRSEVLSFGRLVELLRDPPPEVIADADADDARSLVQTLGLLVTGSLRGVFSDDTTVELDMDAPAMELDISPVSRSGDKVALSAAMLAVWSHSMSTVDGQLALAQHGLSAPIPYLAVLDELWQAFGSSATIIDEIDSLTRINRARMMGQIMITHTLSDLAAVNTPEARAKAAGFVNRSGTVFLGALSDEDGRAVQDMMGLSNEELRMITSWRANKSWDGRSDHPGRGKFLLKTGGRYGLPIHLKLTDRELKLYDTDLLAKMQAGMT